MFLELPAVEPHFARTAVMGWFHRQGLVGACGNKLKLLATGFESQFGPGHRYHGKWPQELAGVGARKVLGEGRWVAA